MTSLDISELDDEHEGRKDFRRANGAPLVSNPDDPSKTERYSRPSNYGKDLDDEEALQKWRIFKAMQGVATSRALQAEVIACKEEDRVTKKELREKALSKGAANEDADMGTALHAMTVRAEDPTDVDFLPGEPYDSDLGAYRQFLTDYGVISEMTEVPLVNDEYRTAGTADRIYRLTRELITPSGEPLPIGELVCADLKTGKKLDFSLPAYAVQIALYASGQLYDVIAERRLPTPPINQRWGILVHLPVGRATCMPLWMDLTIGNYGAWISHEVRDWQRKWRNGTHDAPLIAPPNQVETLLVEAFPDSQIYGGENPELTMMMNEYCRARVDAIGLHPKARARLLQRWPSGVPTPRQGITDYRQIIAVIVVLDDVEAEFSLPFALPDPRSVMGIHHSEVVRH